jgi:hypothetical protein
MVSGIPIQCTKRSCIRVVMHRNCWLSQNVSSKAPQYRYQLQAHTLSVAMTMNTNCLHTGLAQGHVSLGGSTAHRSSLALQERRTVKSRRTVASVRCQAASTGAELCAISHGAVLHQCAECGLFDAFVDQGACTSACQAVLLSSTGFALCQ